MPVRDRQISVRITSEIDAWLEQQAGQRSKKASFVRALIEKEMARVRHQQLLEMFNEAAAEVDDEELENREQLVSAFAGFEEEPDQNGGSSR